MIDRRFIFPRERNEEKDVRDTFMCLSQANAGTENKSRGQTHTTDLRRRRVDVLTTCTREIDAS